MEIVPLLPGVAVYLVCVKAMVIVLLVLVAVGYPGFAKVTVTALSVFAVVVYLVYVTATVIALLALAAGVYLC